MKRPRALVAVLATLLLLGLAAWPVLAQSLQQAQLLAAPDGVLFVVSEGVRYRVTPRPASEAELGTIPEGTPLPPGLLAPVPSPIPSSGPAGREPIRPTAELGLTREAPIPLGATCSCTIDRAGPISQFDISISRVVRDAFPILQQQNRFNKPPYPGAQYLGVQLDIKYIAGPEDQAYTLLDSDFQASSVETKLRDPAMVIAPELRLQADAYPGATVVGWVFFEIPRDAPAYLVWQYSFVGERGVWFALQ
jgi:hypothetical protein